MQVSYTIMEVVEVLEVLEALFSGVPHHGSLRTFEILESSEFLESSKFSGKALSWKS